MREATITLGFWDFAHHDADTSTVEDLYRVMRQHGINALFTTAGLFHYDRANDLHDFSRHLSIDEKGRATITWKGSHLERRLEAAKAVGFRKVVYSPGFRNVVTKAVKARVDRKCLDKQNREGLHSTLCRYEQSKHFDLIKQELTNVSDKYYPIFSEAYAQTYVAIVKEIMNETKRRG